MRRSTYSVAIAIIIALASIIAYAPSAEADRWRGKAPFCNGECKSDETLVRRDNCGEGACCWTGTKALCRGISDCPPPDPAKCYGVGLWCDNGCNRYLCGFCIGFSESPRALQPQSYTAEGEVGSESMEVSQPNYGFEGARMITGGIARVTKGGHTFYLIGGLDNHFGGNDLGVPPIEPPPGVNVPANELAEGREGEPPGEGDQQAQDLPPTTESNLQERLEELGLTDYQMVNGYIVELETDQDGDPIYVIVEPDSR